MARSSSDVTALHGSDGASVCRRRSARRGTVLVVVLGLLVILALIAIAFGFIVSAEFESSQNALIRFRALSASKDGEAYAIAQLRAVALSKHYEPEGSWSFNTSFAEADAKGRRGPTGSERYDDYLKRYARNARINPDNPNILFSFSKNNSTSDQSNSPDSNWVDLNGNGKVDGEERALARDILSTRPQGLRHVSYFVADGVDLKIRRTETTAGTRRELGDRARLKVIDTNSQFPINNFTGWDLVFRLEVIGKEIERIAGSGQNPFPPTVAEAIARHKQERFDIIGSKDTLVEYMPSSLDPEVREFTLDMIAIHTWPTTDPGAKGSAPYFADKRLPESRERVPGTGQQPQAPRELKRHSDTLGKGMHMPESDREDGVPHLEPSGARNFAAPININTVQLPVLVAMLAGIEAEPRFLYYPSTARQLQDDGWARLVGYFDGRRMAGKNTTDAGRQIDHEGNTSELLVSDPTLPNTANYQVIPVGPLGHEVKPRWKGSSTASDAANPWYGGNHAYNIARAIIEERERSGPFKSWMDFDWRICHGLLAGFKGASSNMENVPDLVRTNRSSIRDTVNMSEMPKGSGVSDRHLLPDPQAVSHPASARNDNPRHSYNQAEFDAWYWRACVDMIRTNFNPNGYYNKTNPDAAAYTVVDSTDMRVQTNPICFSSMGVYEVVSQGEITAVRIGTSSSVSATSSSMLQLEYPLARRTIRSVVEVYRVLEHTTQSDFTRAPDKNAFRPASVTAGSDRKVTVIEAPVALSAFGTNTYPNSIDMGSYNFGERQYNTQGERVGTPRGLKGRDGGAESEPLHGGYFSTVTADDRFGYVGLWPQDRSPNRATGLNSDSLNFWAVYNTSLEARRVSNVFGNLHLDGHVPYSVRNGKGGAPGDELMSRSWNSASPDPNRLDWGEQGWKGFEVAARRSNGEGARYANLRPDGVRLSSWSLNPAFHPESGSGVRPEDTYRLQDRIVSRLAALVYRAGANTPSDTPFGPVGGQNPSPQAEDVAGSDLESAVIKRMTGKAVNFLALDVMGGNQGTDAHNIALQNLRQQQTNFPYYEGWIDFWIKWELPPQGKSGSVTMAGEIDPGSGNFSGLLGATSYGRFEANLNAGSSMGSAAGVDRNFLSSANDFEGAQFYVFKEPGGVIRVTHIYFNRAYTVPIGAWQRATGAIAAFITGDYVRIGSNARIHGRQDDGTPGLADGDPDAAFAAQPDEFAFTNDIASGALDLGFSFVRNESYFDLNEPGDGDVKLATHNWYRFSLKYVSNSRHSGTVAPDRAEPHQLFIDGRKVARAGPILPNPLGTLGSTALSGINTGEVTDVNGQAVTANFDGVAMNSIVVQRSSSLLGEVDPGDKLTIGCVYRHIRNEDLQTAGQATSTSLFRFQENVIAPANATIDDVRITRELQGASSFDGTYSEAEYAAFSRFHRADGPNPNASALERAMYENGFVATQVTGGRTTTYTFPIRLGSLTWTESRPIWDPYRGKRMDVSETAMARAPQVALGYQTFPDISMMEPNGAMVENVPLTYSSVSRADRNHWLAGGYALTSTTQNGVPVYLNNNYTNPNSPAVGFFKYQAWFISPAGSATAGRVLNVSPILDDVRLTMLTPPRRVFSEEIYE